jgi:hypothetical protein
MEKEAQGNEVQQEAEPSGKPQIDVPTRAPHEWTETADDKGEPEDFGEITKVEPG